MKSIDISQSTKILELIKPAPQELNSSYLSRLAYFNGLTISRLLTSVFGNRALLFKDIDLLNFASSELSGNIEVAESLADSFFTTSIRRHGTKLINTPYSVCTSCIREKAYIGMESRNSMFHTCPSHHTKTIDSCRCGAPIQPEDTWYDFKNKTYICPRCRFDLLEELTEQQETSTFQRVIIDNHWPNTCSHFKPNSEAEIQAAGRLLVKLAQQVIRKSESTSPRSLDFNKQVKKARELLAEKVSHWLDHDWPNSLKRDISDARVRLSFQESYLKGNERWLTSALTNSRPRSTYYTPSTKLTRTVPNITPLLMLTSSFSLIFSTSPSILRFLYFRNFLIYLYALSIPKLNVKELNRVTCQEARVVRSPIFLFFLNDFLEFRENLGISSRVLFCDRFGAQLENLTDIRHPITGQRLFIHSVLSKLHRNRNAIAKVTTGRSYETDLYSPTEFITYLALIAYGKLHGRKTSESSQPPQRDLQ